MLTAAFSFSVHQNGTTALCLAVEKGRSEVVAALLSNSQLDVNLQDEDGRTALSIAICANQTSIVQQLLAHPNLACDLSFQVSPSNLLLLHPPPVSLMQAHDISQGRCPLAWAILLGQQDAARLLVDDPRVDVNQQDDTGASPLLIAARESALDLLQSLLSSPRVDVNLPDDEGLTPLMVALSSLETTSRESFALALLSDPRILVNLTTPVRRIPSRSIIRSP